MARTVTVRPSDSQEIEWGDAARLLGRFRPSFVAYAASWTARYLRERESANRPDPIALRIEAKTRLGALLKAAKQAVGRRAPTRTVPVSHRGTLQDPAGDLRRAINGVNDFMETRGKYWRKGEDKK